MSDNESDALRELQAERRAQVESEPDESAQQLAGPFVALFATFAIFLAIAALAIPHFGYKLRLSVNNPPEVFPHIWTLRCVDTNGVLSCSKGAGKMGASTVCSVRQPSLEVRCGTVLSDPVTF